MELSTDSNALVRAGAGVRAGIVALGDVSKLYDLAKSKSPEARDELTCIVSGALDTDLSPREAELVSDILIKLLKQAERDFRLALSEKLSLMDDVPLRLVLHLANDEIDVARPVLKASPVLGEFDLLYIIKSKTAAYWKEIATREELSDKVMGVLAETKDFDTALALSENEHISLTDDVLNVLADMAQGSDVLAVPLLRRPEVSADIATMLYRYVSAEIKQFIVSNYDVSVEKVEAAVKTVEDEFTSPVPKDFMPEGYMIEAARAAHEKGHLNSKMFLSALRRGHVRSFIAQLSVYTDLPIEMIGQIMSQTNGQGMAVISKAYDIDKQDFISMFMLTNKLWNYGRVVEAHDLHAAIGYYNRATKDVALEIIRSKKPN